MATLFVIVAIVSAFIVSLRKPWTKIVVRVAGSWVAAMGMLMFGRLMRSQGCPGMVEICWINISPKIIIGK